ncbi:MAG: response regulator [Candidatus Paceibacterota bacterium]|jgi:two-component system phosphate regulon response regulator PhoB
MTVKEKMPEKKHVLIIEDDAFLVKIVTIHLEKEGFVVTNVSNAEDARVLFKKEPPHVVLLDLMLPGVSGFELLEEMKKHETWKNTHVVILSNLSKDSDIELGKKLGAHEYIVKAKTKIADIAGIVASVASQE